MRTIVRKPKTRAALCGNWNTRSSRIAGQPKANMSEQPSILIVEDEYPLQGVLEMALAEAGFTSDILASGEEAITVFVARGKHHKALVTDVYLGGKLNGWDLARRMREKDPTLPVVYITGSAGAALWKSQGVPNSVLLEKPFQPERLVAALMGL
ncbi:response regulator [Bradyrhizobium sp. WSM3983]|uniref:response regulator n=1 Tax=Bradyrhizobium sp. WSM3983 TaxID=1038867 RepID=UPI00352782E0